MDALDVTVFRPLTPTVAMWVQEASCARPG